MKIAGIELGQPSEIIIPIIRGDQEVIFQASCIIDFDELNKVLVEPEPPSILKRGETIPAPVFNDSKYLKAISDYSANKMSWMICKSLLATENLEWDTIDFSNPETWKNYESELKSVGFNEFQIMQLVRGVMEANGLSGERIVEARKRFLATKQEAKASSSLQVEQPNI